MNDFNIFCQIKASTKFQFWAMPPDCVGVNDLTKIKMIGITINSNTITT